MLALVNKYKVYFMFFIISLLPYEVEYRALAYFILWTLYGTYCVGLTIKYKHYINHGKQKRKLPVAAESKRDKASKK